MDENFLKEAPVSYELWAYRTKKKGIWITVESNVSFKIANLTELGEKYLDNFEMDLIIRKKVKDVK